MYTTNQTIRQAMRSLLTESLADRRDATDSSELATTIFRETRAANDGARVLPFPPRKAT